MEDENSIGAAMVDYFKKIFTSTGPSKFDPILQVIEMKVVASTSADLTRELTASEVEKTLKQMKALSDPRLNGMSSIFL